MSRSILAWRADGQGRALARTGGVHTPCAGGDHDLIRIG